ncbi:MAG: hypothetical protein K8T26_20410 [Lentisphaerae bacterium]|nr:hypothetical protein [Lentisphaerota bacterium]
MLFELEHVAVGGRQIKFDLLKAALKTQRVDLSEALFSRYCLHRVPKEGLKALLKSTGKSGFAEVWERYAAGLVEAFSSPRLKLEPVCEMILKTSRKLNARLGALSSLDAATTETLARQLDLGAHGVVLHLISQEDTRTYSGDHWLHLARKVDTLPRKCLTICTQSDSCRAAIAARLRCVGLPDIYTSFEDFGGADYVGESLTAAVFENLLTGGDE